MRTDDHPAGGRYVPLFWELVLPAVPLVWVVAPGLWRNLCPVAAANQLPRRFGFKRATPGRRAFAGRGYAVAVLLFVVGVSAREALLEDDGRLLGVLLLGVATLALGGGMLFPGKSGWCSTVCPLLPVERFYGQLPIVPVANGHCNPCIGCTIGCYDVALKGGGRATSDRRLSGRFGPFLFAGAFPALVVAFFTLPAGSKVSMVGVGSRLAVAMLAGGGAFTAARAVLGSSRRVLSAVSAAVTLNVFYWYSGPVFAAAVNQVTTLPPALVAWLVRVTVLAVTIAWLARVWRVEGCSVTRVARSGRTAERPARWRPTVVPAIWAFAVGLVALAGATMFHLDGQGWRGFAPSIAFAGLVGGLAVVTILDFSWLLWLAGRRTAGQLLGGAAATRVAAAAVIGAALLGATVVEHGAGGPLAGLRSIAVLAVTLNALNAHRFNRRLTTVPAHVGGANIPWDCFPTTCTTVLVSQLAGWGALLVAVLTRA